MAIVSDKTLIAKVQQSAKSLGVAATWATSGRPVNLADDFIFELYVLFELIIDANNYYDIVYVQGRGDKRDRFPQKPANKKDWPKFEIYEKQVHVLQWQVCAGTIVKDIHDIERAPDISIQSNTASDDPRYTDVELIWDAKYRKNPKDRITHAEISEFGRWLELFNLRHSSKPSFMLSSLRSMVANCLVTNGVQSTEPDAERTRLDLKEVASFYPGAEFVVCP
ncbi:hypothetical protein ACFLXA_01630 [Chloroflexota bacterium]